MTDRIDPVDPVKRWRTVARAAIGIALASLLGTGISTLVAVEANNGAERAQEAVDEVVATRTEARAVTCESDNRFANGHNALVGAVQQVLRNVQAGAQNPEAINFLQAQIDALNANQVEVRDCSPEAIRQFYEGAKP